MQVLKLSQPEKGYRYNIDSMLLSRFAQFHEGETVCDLGSGVGLLAILALIRGKAEKAWALEVQEELIQYIHQNSEKYSLQNKLEIIQANWKEVKSHLKAASIDLVMSNPPYRKLQSGKAPKQSVKAIAKHEIEGSMSDLIKAARYLMKRKGRFVVIYPCLRLEDFITALAQQKLKLQRLQFIHPFSNRSATHFMAEAVPSVAGEIVLEAPLIIYQDKDHYRPEIEEWLGSKKSNLL